ncbi:PTS system sugar-specific permease component family protein [Anoxybacillus sp. B7M1]|jgi:galactitol PTS system EIIC component|uniref:PTS galactitol transporter subunit IIC n=1 Tax=Anoxybacteroides rupiense TaxID=311460 RepID=A0ABD5J1E2_9BACL|nr:MULTISPECIES: PTS transporter subunit IIC [Anoxybacillus]ANB56977.1 PTS system sugar-specific permease component family protein [Anoxybacillus sp. B2M1]ANB62762.1 PTS system sugar-specific permease component family protein [Anoxybacillus sp. B7M1]KXG09134.1 Galactitol permease IIC component [Anoxybacillus sp. P3H1B]MBS2770387.1 PTS galactitol transporter subunit IIC [Anoxybacillus rupiensis]MDE8564893.1 PTS galactitol transporter subunit IIC [Anoxybacillus rupiensis]
MDFIQKIVDLGPTVVLPVIIFLFGLVLKMKPGRAFRAGLTVGIGFIGVNLIIGLLVDNLGPAAKDMVERLGIDLSIIDVGWPATSAIAFGSTVGALAIPIGLIVNFILLIVGLTKTLNIDLWNLWHIAFTGALVSIMTDSFAMGIVTASVHAIVLLVLADMSQKHVEKFYGYPNISFPHGTSTPYILFAWPLEKLFNMIPGFKNLKADPESIQKRLGILGESTVLGLILGLIIGILAGWNAKEVLNLGVSTAAVMLLLPRMVSILMEGLAPVSESASEFVKSKFPGREVFIGMDSALAVGHPAAIASSLIMVPIVLLLAIIVPGNKVLPFGDLATIPFIVSMMVPIFRGNVIRTVVASTIALGFGLLLATYISPLFTQAAKNVGFSFPEGTNSISSLVDGAVPTTAIFLFGAKLGYIGLIIIALIALATAYYINKRPNKTNES